jgi:O-acetyl-ADP-ribose deacetylase (regulator of RNase III)
MPDPRTIENLAQLAAAFTQLRRRAAKKGQIQLSVRDLSTRTDTPPSTLDPYLRGDRLCPPDVFEAILHALGIEVWQMGPWSDAWDRIAATKASGRRPVSHAGRPSPGTAGDQKQIRYRIHSSPADISVGIINGRLVSVRNVDVWVNSENTHMRMSRFEEYSVSAVIRFHGATRNEIGHIIEDLVADELAAKVRDRVPVAPATAIVTGSGNLLRTNGVRHIVHVASVHGEPGHGYRPVADIGQCVAAALAAATQITPKVASIVLPLLGTGVGRGPIEPTVRTMLNSAIEQLADRPDGLETVLFLATTAEELEVCRRVFASHPQLKQV